MRDEKIASLVELRDFEPNGGYGYIARLPAHFPLGDREDQLENSGVVLFQDGIRLGPSHAVHAEIREKGAGRYSHWQDVIYLSARDNSDPRTNGCRFHALHLLASGDDSPKRFAIEGLAALPDEFTPGAAYGVLDRALGMMYPGAILEIGGTPFSTARETLGRAAALYRSALGILRESEVSFLSIMKSGRTWVRFFLQKYLEGVTGTQLSLVPQALPKIGPYPSICFHHGFFEVFEGLPGDPVGLFEDEMAGRPLVLLTRDPRDVAVSYYYYTRKRDPLRFKHWVSSGTLNDFLPSPIFGLDRIARVEEIEREFFDRHPGPKLAMSYEEITCAPRDQFERLLRFLSLAPIDAAAFTQALAKSSFGEMQALDIEISRAGRAQEYGRLGVDDWSGDINELNVRSGTVGGFAQIRPDLADPTVLRRDFPVAARLLQRLSATPTDTQTSITPTQVPTPRPADPPPGAEPLTGRDPEARLVLSPPFEPEIGACWLCYLGPLTEAALLRNMADDDAAPDRSAVRLYEDGHPLGPAHAAHASIRSIGHGAFSHWKDALYFSTSDNSDPNLNGRQYALCYPMR